MINSSYGMPPSKARRTLRRIVCSGKAGLAYVDSLTGLSLQAYVMDIVATLLDPKRILRRIRAAITPNLLHLGKRSTIRRIETSALPKICKLYSDDVIGQACFSNEKHAQELFGGFSWKMPILEWRKDGFVMPEFPSSSRLDLIARTLTPGERVVVATDVLEIAFDLFMLGYAHCDFHAGNMFLHSGSLILGDFETLAVYDTCSIPFAKSYDLTGEGLASPHDTGRMHYSHSSDKSLIRVLGVPLEEAMEGMRARLRGELLEACRSFKSTTQADQQILDRRHLCRTEIIYGSFSLPEFKIAPNEAQRDSQRRFTRFGVGVTELSGRTLLDLGCNVGAMSFAAQSFSPVKSLGIEYDNEKVNVASRIARFCGLSTVQFRQGNVDYLGVEDLGVHDVVFCLAIEAHVADPERLYRLLGEVTRQLLLFEGNAECDVELVENRLRAAGFSEIEFRGYCDDDMRPANNNRPMFVARKASA